MCFDLEEGRYYITTGTREVSLAVRGVGMALEGEEEIAGQGSKYAVGGAGRNGGGVRAS
jgi:hypothetical protein